MNDRERYLAASHHHYWCEVCVAGHDDRGIPEGTCEPKIDQLRDVAELAADLFIGDHRGSDYLKLREKLEQLGYLRCEENENGPAYYVAGPHKREGG